MYKYVFVIALLMTGCREMSHTEVAETRLVCIRDKVYSIICCTNTYHTNTSFSCVKYE